MSNTWITDYLDKGDFTGLFVEVLGWERPPKRGRSVSVATDEGNMALQLEAEFRGVGIWTCRGIPSGKTQRLIDNVLRKESTERVVIFHDEQRQVWRWPQARDAAGAGAPRLIAHEHIVGRPNEALRQRLKFVEIGMEEDVSVLEVVRRLRRAFDSEKVTKSFYGKFAAEHHALTAAIKGIEVTDKVAKTEVRWYGSLLLNRLMFIYFMQRKGFLDGDVDYLRNRLARLKKLKRKDSFYSFYKDFLIPLFHEGLGADRRNRDIKDESIEDLLGDVPYVNGGIFSKHPLETSNDIAVPDKAFEKIFDFFDQWQWHLDDRPSGNPNEINPDVLGYIFEQFVNNSEEVAKGSKDAATNVDKGAYYTKEDVTGYMTSNTLVPVFLERLVDRTGVNPWKMLANDPDRYIWTSVKHGMDQPLPAHITSSATSWPRPEWDSTEIDSSIALPAESWWEVVDRRRHVERLISEAKAGRINTIESAITNNLDLESLAIDTIDALDSPADVHATWEILTDLKIIDPTCGSGAFLFAALNILHRLYTSAYEAAIAHASTSNHEGLTAIRLAAAGHPNRNYFILKHAALSNLHGVDLMPEAVEIARLRLFLKLIAQIDSRSDIEPLPDLEFNIRVGNILVGALDSDSIREKIDLLSQDRVGGLEEAASRAADAYESFSIAQRNDNHLEVVRAKSRLMILSEDVRNQLDKWWFESEHGANSFQQYLSSFQPFHWFIEFPGVFANGGFDVVIGNPPYVATTKIGYSYGGFRTDRCPDIYAPCLERASTITRETGRLSMIVPMNLAWGGEFSTARTVLTGRFGSIWASTYDQMPSRLFEGVGTRNTVVLAGPGEQGVHTASFNKWVSDFRPHLLATQRYMRHESIPEPWPKVGHTDLAPIATSTRGGLGASCVKHSKYRLGHKKIANYWLSVFRHDPPAMDAKRRPIPQKVVSDIYFRSESDMFVALAISSSRLMFLWWIFTADMFNVKSKTFTDFPILLSDLSASASRELENTGRQLDNRLSSEGEHILWTPYAGEWYGNFDLTRCRDLTDEADKVLLEQLTGEPFSEAFEVEYRNYMKSGGERPGTVRGAKPDRDR